MADITANTGVVSESRPNPVVRFFAAIWNGLLAIGEQNARVKKIEYYMSMSDAELARRGLKRDNIVHYVFRDTGLI